MSYSLNEVQAIARKAARGAGYPWGLADEASVAVRWLCAHGVDGGHALSRLLQFVDAHGLEGMMPLRRGSEWSSEGDFLCPVAAGAALSDHAFAVSAAGFVFGPTVSPVLLLPFAASVAATLEHSVRVSWDWGEGTTDGKELGLSGSLSDRASSVQVAVVDQFVPSAGICHRASLKPTVLDVLAEFERRTYAPATEASRLKGAGAGTSDND